MPDPLASPAIASWAALPRPRRGCTACPGVRPGSCTGRDKTTRRGRTSRYHVLSNPVGVPGVFLTRHPGSGDPGLGYGTASRSSEGVSHGPCPDPGWIAQPLVPAPLRPCPSLHPWCHRRGATRRAGIHPALLVSEALPGWVGRHPGCLKMARAGRGARRALLEAARSFQLRACGRPHHPCPFPSSVVTTPGGWMVTKAYSLAEDAQQLATLQAWAGQPPGVGARHRRSR